MKIKAKKGRIYSFIILLMAFLVSCSDEFSDFRTVQHFIDSSNYGKIYFSFVEVNDFDTTKMEKFGRMQLEHENTLDFKKNKLPVGVIIPFYNLRDTIPFDSTMSENIQRHYPNLYNAKDKIFYVKNAYIYTSFSKRLENVSIPQNRLFKSDAVIPKEGIDLRSILKQNNNNNKE